MENKLLYVIVAFFGLMVVQQAFAGFHYSHPFPKTSEEIEAAGLKCSPGRTIIRVTSKSPPVEARKSSEEETRRYHMNFVSKDETCMICVCSVDGKNEYCSNRPAMNVNECIRLGTIAEELQKNPTFDHDRVLAYTIRRADSARQCIPYVSEYTDCTDENLCKGCKRCSCTGNGQWSCSTVRDCGQQNEPIITDEALDNALDVLYAELNKNTKRKPQPKSNEDLLLGYLVAT